MFANSVDGANALCLHFSRIRTAKRHNLDRLELIPYCETAEDYETLLPWNIQLQKVGEIIKVA